MPGSGEGLVYVSFSSLSTLQTRAGKVGDFDGNGASDVAVFNPFTATWKIRNQFTLQFGQPRDVAVAGDYNGDGDTDLAVYRPSTGDWSVRNQFTVQWGDPGDVPMPGDYNGDGVTDVAVYRPSTGAWYVRNQLSAQFGSAATCRCRAITTATARPTSRSTGRQRASGSCGTGSPSATATPGTCRCRATTPATALTTSRCIARDRLVVVRNQTAVQSAAGDVPVPATTPGRRADLAVYRPSSGRGSSGTSRPSGTAALATSRAARLDGDGIADVAVYRPSTGQWFDVAVSSSCGSAARVTSRVPGTVTRSRDRRTGDYDGDGSRELAVYRPSTAVVRA